jgi:hypothetical protein
MFMVALIIVRRPDIEKARIFDIEFGDIDIVTDPNYKQIDCFQYAQGMETWLHITIFIHALCFCINLFREIYDTQIGPVGRIMKFVEVIGLGTYGVFTI